MGKIVEKGARVLNIIQAYPASLYGGLVHRRLFEGVETYCSFIGYPRSGHSLIGALLDAHPDMIIAHELGALKYIHAGFSKWQVYQLLLRNSQRFAAAGRKWGKYSYAVPDQWQGRFRKLRVIGDKQGEGTTLRLKADPWLLKYAEQKIGGRIKFVHVIRNPYDNISTIFKKAQRHNNVGLNDSIAYYFSLCETVASVKSQSQDTDWFEFRHEAFIKTPEVYLRGLCRFLGTEAPPDWTGACALIVFQSPHKSRHDSPWNDELIERVQRRITEFPFLQGYSYDS